MFKSQAILKEETLSPSKIFETGIYSTVVDMAYLGISDGGAYSLNLTLKTPDNRTHKETLWITSGKDKGQLTYFINKDNEKQDLPGFAIANAVSILITGKELGDLTPEEKTINVYNFDLKKDVPTNKQVYVDLIGKQVDVAIQKQIVNKTSKAPDGTYKPTGETKEKNEIVSVFNTETKQNVYEYKNGLPAEFYSKWLERYEGKTIDKTSRINLTNSNNISTNKPTKSLFGKQ